MQFSKPHQPSDSKITSVRRYGVYESPLKPMIVSVFDGRQGAREHRGGWVKEASWQPQSDFFVFGHETKRQVLQVQTVKTREHMEIIQTNVVMFI